MIDCLFCRIARGEIPATVVFQNDDVVAFRDTNPQAPMHILVIPRRHIPSLSEMTDQDDALLGQVARVAADIAGQEGLAESGFRCVVNNGPDANQTVLHVHMHVIGGRVMSWPPG